MTGSGGLTENQKDLGGWIYRAESYTVLGSPDEARCQARVIFIVRAE